MMGPQLKAEFVALREGGCIERESERGLCADAPHEFFRAVRHIVEALGKVMSLTRSEKTFVGAAATEFRV